MLPIYSSYVMLLLCTLACLGASIEVERPATAVEIESFRTFVATHRPAGYATEAERASRFAVFRDNLRIIDELQAKAAAEGANTEFGVTKFADLTNAEFRARIPAKPGKGGIPDYPATYTRKPPGGFVPPPAMDWRLQGKVGAVRDQGDCGGCWAFSATETVESGMAMANKPLVNLSVQEVVSCDKHSRWHCPDDDDCRNVDAGCDGGDPVFGILFICNKTKALATEAAYPYASGKGGNTKKCRDPLPTGIEIGCTGFSWGNVMCDTGKCHDQNEQLLQANLAAYGPAAVSVDAGGNGWQMYKRGIMTAARCSGSVNKLDHAVQLVGYGDDNGSKYWLVRNSWNTDWGEDGYIRMAFGDNTCGVTDQPVFADFPGQPYNHF